MTHTPQPHWVDTIGLGAGILGMSIACWLQLVTRRDVDDGWVILFLAIGLGLSLINVEPLWPPGNEIILIARAAGYLLIILFELAVAYHVHTTHTAGDRYNDDSTVHDNYD
jgi:hypothetical protein